MSHKSCNKFESLIRPRDSCEVTAEGGEGGCATVTVDVVVGMLLLVLGKALNISPTHMAELGFSARHTLPPPLLTHVLRNACPEAFTVRKNGPQMLLVLQFLLLWNVSKKRHGVLHHQ